MSNRFHRNSSYSLIAITAALIGCVNWLSYTTLQDYLWLIYLAQYAAVAQAILSVPDRSIALFSPTFLTVSYLSISNILGAYAFPRRLVYNMDDYASFMRWGHLAAAASFFLLCNLAVCLPFFYAAARSRGWRAEGNKPIAPTPGEAFAVPLFCLAVFVLFSAFRLDLSVLGGFGNYSSYPRTLAVLAVVIFLMKTQSPVRYLLYLALIGYFASFSSHS
ncbi:MAG: hypothetical protein KDD69_08250, partial [Bdellovibrionales bacterium]|nr:hypothetical protein [Bdellovibrionales bacterium]